MGVKEAAAALGEGLQNRPLLIDEKLGKAVVAHRDRQVHPRAARDEIRGEEDRAAGHRDLGEHHPGRMAVADMKTVAVAESGTCVAADDLKATGGLQELGYLRDK